MTEELKPCPVCGHRVSIIEHHIENLKGGRDRDYYLFSHHGGPRGYCILEIVLREKVFHNYENMAKLWNTRGEDCEDDSIRMMKL